MPMVPLRELGNLGIITDVDPYDLPPNAFSFGKNIKFENGRVERGNVFRVFGPASGRLMGAYSYVTNTGSNRLLLADTRGYLFDWTPTGQTLVSPSSWSQSESLAPTSIVSLNNLIFVNRPDHIPWYRQKELTTEFSVVPTTAGQWQADWRAQIMRSVAGVFVALNVTKGALALPNDVLWSNFVQTNTVPDWDIASTTSSAGENTLSEMREPILDGLSLKNRLMIYSNTETWYMEYVGGNTMFRFDRQFDKGILSENCVVEVGGLHYVFGSDDIWLHDGTTSKSIAQGRVRNFIFNGLRKSARDAAFVGHNPETNEVFFCYSSSDEYITFAGEDAVGCNRAAIYNYAADTWYFADMPYVSCYTRFIPTASVTFDGSAPISWEDLGGSYSSISGQPNLVPVFGSFPRPADGIGNTLRSFAPPRSASSSLVIDRPANKPVLIQREGLDLDELGAELRGYKLASSIYPQCRIDRDADALVFQFSSNDHPSLEPVEGNAQAFDQTWYKLDHNIAGRYLNYTITQRDAGFFSMTGMDVDLQLLGSR